jgi:hypothetical protein
MKFKVNKPIRDEIYSFEPGVWYELGGDFLIDPTPEGLRAWMKDNNIKDVVVEFDGEDKMVKASLSYNFTDKASQIAACAEFVDAAAAHEETMCKHEDFGTDVLNMVMADSTAEDFCKILEKNGSDEVKEAIRLAKENGASEAEIGQVAIDNWSAELGGINRVENALASYEIG